jgi:hypothetical protein
VFVEFFIARAANPHRLVGEHTYETGIQKGQAGQKADWIGHPSIPSLTVPSERLKGQI